MIGGIMEVVGPAIGLNPTTKKVGTTKLPGGNSLTAKEMRFNENEKQGAEKLLEELAGVAGVIKDAITPAFIQRFNYSKVYQRTIEDAETSVDAVQKNVEKTISKELKLYNKTQLKLAKQAQNLHRQLALKDAAVKPMLEQAREANAKQEMEDYRRRRDLQVAQRKAKLDKERDEQQARDEAEAKQRREHLVQYWGEQAKIMKEEAVVAKERLARREIDQYNLSMDRVEHEWGEREYARAAQQIEGPDNEMKEFLPGKRFPLFGRAGQDDSDPHKQGAELLPTVGRAEDPYVPFEDNHDVHVFHSEPSAVSYEYETKTLDAHEQAADVARSQTLYDSLQRETVQLSHAMERMCQMRENTEKDVFQVQQELKVVELSQIGPPRRLPNNIEQVSTHERKERLNLLRKKVEDVQYTINMADQRKRNAEAQMLSLARKLASGRERNKKIEKELKSVNGDLGTLPMIVGRSISHVPGLNELTAKPKETLDAVTQQSKFIALKEMGKETIQVHKERSELDRQLWIARQDGFETRSDAERVMSKLSEIADRLKHARHESAKVGIIDALKVYHAKQMELDVINTRLSGMLPWFKHHDHRYSSNVVRHRSTSALGGVYFEPEPDSAIRDETLKNGVALGEATTGFCLGYIELPKESVWTIQLTVLRHRSDADAAAEKASAEADVSQSSPSSSSSSKITATMAVADENGDGSPAMGSEGAGDDDQVDENDFVTIRLGPDLGSLKNLGTYYNKVNPQTGSILYDVTYLIRGKSLAFRFDFYSTSTSPFKHLAVEAGQFEEYQIAELEFFQDPKIPSREMVLSSYVKIARMDEAQGKLHEARMLEELVSAEEARSLHWDSDILNLYPQRYDRHYFLRILKAEILLHQHERGHILEQNRSHIVTVVDESKVGVSKKHYEERKRKAQQPEIDAAMDLIGRKIEIFDKPRSTWRHVLVKDCQLTWVENGIIAKLRHNLQEVDDRERNIGGEFSADLSKVRYLMAPTFRMDLQTLQMYTERNNAELRLEVLDAEADKKTVKLKKLYVDYRNSELAVLEEEKNVLRRDWRANAEQDAKRYLDSPQASQLVKNTAARIMLELRNDDGIIDGVRNKASVLQAAKDRVIDDFMEQRRNDMLIQMERTESEIELRIAERGIELKKAMARVLRDVYIERMQLRQRIKEIRSRQKTELQARMRFPPEVFKVAVPQARICEHIRSRAWGTEYGKGIRCLACGKELTEIHKEESQWLGYGSGTEKWLYEAIKRHRENEASFRFKDAEQLAIVESERRRLEKERREMEESELYFYDYEQARVMYDFDRRHAKDIKREGVFRQGLQWQLEEVEQFEKDCVEREKDRLIREKLAVEENMKEFDPLTMIDDPPPTFRREDERHKAQFRDLLFTMGRLQNYQRRIKILKDERLHLLTERYLYSAVLNYLHKDTFKIVHEVEELEKDLDRTGRLIDIFNRMEELWLRASRILSRAEKDKKKAEMRRCGVWEDVKEAKDVLSFLHDETRSLLKTKFLLELNMEEFMKYYRESSRHLASLRDKFEETNSLAEAMSYVRPGEPVVTRYGHCWVRVYRSEDEMVMVTLPFCEPPARAWIPVREIVDAERSRQQAERILMDLEDVAMSKFMSTEKAIIKREKYLMGLEEANIREVFQFLDFGKHEEETTHTAIDTAVKDTYAIMGTKKFERLQKKFVRDKVKAYKQGVKKEIKAYDGPLSGKPKMPSFWDLQRKKKEVNIELRESFLIRAGDAARRSAKNALNTQRAQWIEVHSFENLIGIVIKSMIREVAQECMREGKQAKEAAERKSGLIFPNPPWMQYDAYHSLAAIWKRRKEELRDRIEANKGQAAQVNSSNIAPVIDLDEAKKRNERRRVRRVEKIRQLKMCQEMAVEESRAREFYRWELLENLRERRDMRTEDADSKLMRQDERLKQQAAESVYAVSAANIEQEQEAVVAAASYERRREQLKALTIERRKRDEDRARMVIEDKLSEALRVVDNMERSKKKFEEEYGTSFDSDDESDVFSKDSDGNIFIDLPWWLETPRGWLDWDFLSQKKYLDLHRDLRKRRLRIERKIDLEYERIERQETKSLRVWGEKFVVLQQESLIAELALMTAEEESKDADIQLTELQDNLRKMTIYCRNKGEEELRARAAVRAKETVARQRDKELNEASDWLTLCQRRMRARDKLRKRVTSDCKWTDSDIVTGTYQRFTTESLRKRLYVQYFKEIVQEVVNRAEIVACERVLMRCQEKLTVNKTALVERMVKLKSHRRDVDRDELMRMRRSCLNEKYFPRHRKAVLQARFGSWVRYFYWNRGYREAFTLKYEILKRQIDIERQFKKQLTNNNSKEKERGGSDDYPGKIAAKNNNNPTALARFRERTVQCKECLSFYLETQNHSSACVYHPMRYEMGCPRNCPNPGLTMLCPAHRMRRWKCCDASRNEAPGCSRKYHVPPDVDPIYDRLMAKVQERDADEIADLDARLEHVRSEDWGRKLHDIKQKQVFGIEDDLEDEREVVHRFSKLKGANEVFQADNNLTGRL